MVGVVGVAGVVRVVWMIGVEGLLGIVSSGTGHALTLVEDCRTILVLVFFLSVLILAYIVFALLHFVLCTLLFQWSDTEIFRVFTVFILINWLTQTSYPW